MDPLLTVVIPTDGDDRFVDSWLRLMQQSGAPEGLKVIVVTGDSRLQERLLSMTALNSDISVVRCPSHASAGRARNMGLVAVTTPLVAFVDADDDVNVPFLKDAAARLEEAGCDLAIAPFMEVREGTTGPARSRNVGLPRGSLARDIWSVAGVWRFIFTTRFLRSHGVAFPDLATAEDVGFLLQVVKARPSTLELRQPWYTYRIHSSAQASQRTPRSVADVRDPIAGLWRIAWHNSSPQTIALAGDWTARILGVSVKRALLRFRSGP